jgi:hypothetical protein
VTIGGYREFLDRKTHLGAEFGFDPVWVPDFLFDFQVALVEWACRKGRGAIFADCGLGKTPMQLVWAENVVRKTGRPVLIITPLAVGAQTIEEGAKFGIEVRRAVDGEARPGISVTNYERLHHFQSQDFAGAVCDESSAIKSFSGVHRQIVTDFMRKLEYRLLCTATAAPNDYIELGTSSEALGYLGHMDMLGRFFKNDQNTIKPVRRWTAQRTGLASQSAGGDRGKWRFKGHAEEQFWRWVCSWGRAMRRPSDLGFNDTRFILPALEERQHIVQARRTRQGWLFDLPVQGLQEEREEQRRTIEERCEMAAELVNDTGQPAVCWCHLNDEGNLLAKMIPDSVQVSGSDTLEEKEERLLAFSHGQTRVLVIKPKIGAWGLNWQHCAHMAFFPSHSFEQYYQAVRRSWRFGQERPVVVDIVTTEGGAKVLENLQRKAEQADRMFSSLVRHMADELAIKRVDGFTKEEEIPSWL